MKCEYCDGTGEIINDALRWTSCPVCGGKGEVEQTNEEWLRQCNTEQLAEFLCDVWYGIDEVINIMSEDGEISKKDAMELWLKQPHNRKDDEE